MSTPHLVQYQGSKRLLAPDILRHVPSGTKRLVEPFCGVCAVSIAAAEADVCDEFWINDINAPLVSMMREAIEEPDRLADAYEEIWSAQFSGDGDHVAHFLSERQLFNADEANRTPARMLYLIARCVKGAVRYDSAGRLNQSCDKRRHGTNPKRIRTNARAISKLLKGRCRFTSIDYLDVFSACDDSDILYLDPPYQGTSFVRDHRYFQGVRREELIDGLAELNSRGVGYLLSYDGECGDKSYGEDLPEDLGCEKLMLQAGRSTQSTLLGKSEQTVEALYVSPSLLLERSA